MDILHVRENQIKGTVVSCFTIQEQAFTVQPNDVWVCDPNAISPHWRNAYDWMKTQYRQFMRIDCALELLWVWKQCSDRDALEDQYTKLVALYPDIAIARGYVIIELAIPEGVVLFSSYQKWNVLMEYTLAFGGNPGSREDWLGMFDCEALPEHDSIQGVIPRIERRWVTNIREVEESLLRQYGAVDVTG